MVHYFVVHRLVYQIVAKRRYPCALSKTAWKKPILLPLKNQITLKSVVFNPKFILKSVVWSNKQITSDPHPPAPERPYNQSFAEKDGFVAQ